MNTTGTAHDLKKYKIHRKKHKVKFIVTLSLVKNFWLYWISVAEHGLLIVMAFLVAEHRLRCPVACGIFPEQGLNLCSLHWQGFLTIGPAGKSLLK